MTGSGAVTGSWQPGARRLEFADRMGHVALELSFVLPGRDVTAEEGTDEDVLVLVSDALRIRLRIIAAGRAQSVHLTIDNRTADPADLTGVELDLDSGPQHAGWYWASGPHAVFAAFGAGGGRPGVLVRLRSGYALRSDSGPAFEHPGTSRTLAPSPAEPGSGGASVRLTVPDGPLAPYGRLGWSFEVAGEADVAAFAAALPPWLPTTVVDADSFIEFREPDLAVVAESDVLVEESDTEVTLSAQPGHHEIAVHGPRGVDRFGLTWAPSELDVLASVAAAAVRGRPAKASDADGLVVAEALARGIADEAALDWAEAVDWLDRGSLLGDATAGILAALTVERLAFDEVWRQLERRTPEAGFGLVVARLGAAGFAGFGTPPRTQPLLAAAGTGSDAAVELALLRSGDADWWTEELDGYALTLGADLPGRALGLAGVRAAYLASVLRLTPEGWSGRRAALDAVLKTERMLLADYGPAMGARRANRAPADALAWLTLGRLGM